MTELPPPIVQNNPGAVAVPPPEAFPTLLRFAELIEKAVLTPGDQLTNSDPINPVTAIVSEDYGLLVDGVRHESPDLAAIAATGTDGVDGWGYWTLQRDHKPVASLAELRAK